MASSVPDDHRDAGQQRALLVDDLPANIRGALLRRGSHGDQKKHADGHRNNRFQYTHTKPPLNSNPTDSEEEVPGKPTRLTSQCEAARPDWNGRAYGQVQRVRSEEAKAPICRV